MTHPPVLQPIFILHLNWRECEKFKIIEVRSSASFKMLFNSFPHKHESLQLPWLGLVKENW